MNQLKNGENDQKLIQFLHQVHDQDLHHQKKREGDRKRAKKRKNRSEAEKNQNQRKLQDDDDQVKVILHKDRIVLPIAQNIHQK